MRRRGKWRAVGLERVEHEAIEGRRREAGGTEEKEEEGVDRSAD